MIKNAVKYPAPGCIVEFMQGNRPVQAWVLEGQSGSLRLYSISKRELKLQAGRILPWAGPSYSPAASRQEMQEKLELHRKLREEYAGGTDLNELWSLAQGELAQAAPEWFAELLWPEPDIDMLAGLGQAMLAEKTRFRFSPPFFEVFTEEQVQSRLQKQEQEQRLNELVPIGVEFFRKLHEAAKNRKKVDDREIPQGETAEVLRQLLLTRISDPDTHDPEGLWKLLTKGLAAKSPNPKSTVEDQFLPLILATAWGIVPEHHNYWLDRAGYDTATDWDEPFKQDLDGILDAINQSATIAAEGSSPISNLPFISIDPEITRDFDDAIHIAKHDCGYKLSIALSCPAAFWPFGSELDKTVLRRSTSIYLPEGSYHMMPESLCLNAFSLKQGELRQSLVLALELDENGAVLSAKPSIEWVMVKANLGQRDCEALFEGRPSPAAEPYADILNAALELARKLQQGRLDNGAVITERDEIEIKLNDDGSGIKVDIARAEAIRLCQLVVGELMILGNRALAQWGMERELPLLYRTQDVALPKDFSGIWTRPEEISRVLKALPPSSQELDPKPHAGIGVPVYSSFTAPMRRYPDLLNETQVVSTLLTGAPRFSRSDLQSMLPLLSTRLDQAGQIQRYRPRYWKLLYLQQQELAGRGKLNYRDAVITDENNHFVTITLDLVQLIVRGSRSLFPERSAPGMAVQVRLGKINPLRNEIQIMEVIE